MDCMDRLSDALGPVVDLLDPRDAALARSKPIRCSVNIPLAELQDRAYELPPRGEALYVAETGPEALAVVDRLRARGMDPALRSDYVFGGAARARLWRPNSLVSDVVSALAPGKALDLACGTGRDAVALASLEWDVVAADILPDALDRGRALASRYLVDRAGSITWREADLRCVDAELGDGYDLVSAFFYYAPGIVERAARLLRPGGSLLLEAFTPAHRERKGRPGPTRVVTPENLAGLHVPLRIRLLEAGRTGDMDTVRMWAVHV